MDDCGYRGISGRFGDLRGADRDAYTELMERFAALLRPRGVWVCSAVAPRPSPDDGAAEREASDHCARGALADFVVVTPGASGRPATQGNGHGGRGGMPTTVSLSEMREATDRGLAEIPADKVLLGMPVPAGDLDALVLADELGVRGVSYPSLPGAEDWSALAAGVSCASAPPRRRAPESAALSRLTSASSVCEGRPDRFSRVSTRR